MNEEIELVVNAGMMFVFFLLPVMILCITYARMTMIKKVIKSNDTACDKVQLRDFAPEGIKYVEEASGIVNVGECERKIEADFPEE